MKKSITLVELIISMTLLGVIVLGAVAFHLSAERFLSSSERKTQVLNELTYVLQHLQKNITLAIGDVSNPGIWVAGAPPILRIRQDVNSTPDNYADDMVVGYRFNLATGIIDFEGVDNLTTRFVQVAGNPFSIVAGVAANGGVAITNLALRLDPTIAENPVTNPEVTTIDAGAGRTIYFYSLTHSWN